MHILNDKPDSISEKDPCGSVFLTGESGVSGLTLGRKMRHTANKLIITEQRCMLTLGKLKQTYALPEPGFGWIGRSPQSFRDSRRRQSVLNRHKVLHDFVCLQFVRSL